MAEEGSQNIDTIGVGLVLDTSQFDARLEASAKKAAAFEAERTRVLRAPQALNVSPSFKVTQAQVRGLRVDINQHMAAMGARNEAVAIPVKLGASDWSGMRAQISQKIGSVPISVSVNTAGVRAGGRTAVASHSADPVQVLAAWVAQSQGISLPTANNQIIRAARSKGISGRARGGPVVQDRDYLVGEDGPEVVRFNRPATVIPAYRGKRVQGRGAKYGDFKPRYISVADHDAWGGIDGGEPGRYAYHATSQMKDRGYYPFDPGLRARYGDRDRIAMRGAGDIRGGGPFGRGIQPYTRNWPANHRQLAQDDRGWTVGKPRPGDPMYAPWANWRGPDSEYVSFWGTQPKGSEGYGNYLLRTRRTPDFSESFDYQTPGGGMLVTDRPKPPQSLQYLSHDGWKKFRRGRARAMGGEIGAYKGKHVLGYGGKWGAAKGTAGDGESMTWFAGKEWPNEHTSETGYLYHGTFAPDAVRGRNPHATMNGDDSGRGIQPVSTDRHGLNTPRGAVSYWAIHSMESSDYGNTLLRTRKTKDFAGPYSYDLNEPGVIATRPESDFYGVTHGAHFSDDDGSDYSGIPYEMVTGHAIPRSKLQYYGSDDRWHKFRKGRARMGGGPVDDHSERLDRMFGDKPGMWWDKNRNSYAYDHERETQEQYEKRNTDEANSAWTRWRTHGSGGPTAEDVFGAAGGRRRNPGGGAGFGTKGHSAAPEDDDQIAKLKRMATQETQSPNEAAIAKSMLRRRGIPGYMRGGYMSGGRMSQLEAHATDLEEWKRNLLTHARAIPREIVASAAEWYPVARAQAMGDLADFGREGSLPNIGAFAAASPGQPWPLNRAILRRILEEGGNNIRGSFKPNVPGFTGLPPVGVGYGYSNWDKAAEILRSGDISGLKGPKVTPFFGNLSGTDPEAWTLDARQMRIASANQIKAAPGGGSWQRAVLERAHEDVFPALQDMWGVKHRSQAQAILWSGYGRGEDTGNDFERTATGIVIPRHPGIHVPLQGMRAMGGYCAVCRTRPRGGSSVHASTAQHRRATAPHYSSKKARTPRFHYSMDPYAVDDREFPVPEDWDPGEWGRATGGPVPGFRLERDKNRVNSLSLRAFLDDGSAMHGNDVGVYDFRYMGDDALEPSFAQTSGLHRRKGLATWAYAEAERMTGRTLVKPPRHSPLAAKLWAQPDRPFGRERGGPITRTFRVGDPNGLHMRPSGALLRAAAMYSAHLSAQNVTNGQELDNPNSIYSWMTLGGRKGHQIRVSAAGDDARQALDTIGKVIRFNPEKTGQSYADFHESLGLRNPLSRLFRETGGSVHRPGTYARMLRDTFANEGGTFDALTGKQPSAGFAVGVHEGDFRSVELTNIRAAMEAMRDAAKYAQSTGTPYVGTWSPRGSGRIAIDPSTVFDTKEAAARLGVAKHQDAIYDIRNRQEIYLAYKRAKKRASGGRARRGDLPKGYTLSFFNGTLGMGSEFTDPPFWLRRPNPDEDPAERMARRRNLTAVARDAHGEIAADVPFSLQPYRADHDRYPVDANDGQMFLHPEMTQVNPGHRGKGLATAIYATTERWSGREIMPSEIQTPFGQALWAQKDRPFGRSFGPRPLDLPSTVYNPDEAERELQWDRERNRQSRLGWHNHVPGDGYNLGPDDCAICGAYKSFHGPRMAGKFADPLDRLDKIMGRRALGGPLDGLPEEPGLARRAILRELRDWRTSYDAPGNLPDPILDHPFRAMVAENGRFRQEDPRTLPMLQGGVDIDGSNAQGGPLFRADGGRARRNMSSGYLAGMPDWYRDLYGSRSKDDIVGRSRVNRDFIGSDSMEDFINRSGLAESSAMRKWIAATGFDTQMGPAQVGVPGVQDQRTVAAVSQLIALQRHIRDIKPHAQGGDAGGGTYLVGELQPELFVPDRLRYIIPEDVMAKLPKRSTGGETRAKGSGVIEVGTRGPHLFTPPEDGWIIPHTLVGRVNPLIPRAANGAPTFDPTSGRWRDANGRFLTQEEARRRGLHPSGNAAGVPRPTPSQRQTNAASAIDVRPTAAETATFRENLEYAGSLRRISTVAQVQALSGRTPSSAVAGAASTFFGGRSDAIQNQARYNLELRRYTKFMDTHAETLQEAANIQALGNRKTAQHTQRLADLGPILDEWKTRSENLDAIEKSVKPGLGAIGKNFLSVLGATTAYGLAMQAVSGLIAVATPAIGQVVDQAMNFTATSQRVTKGLSQQSVATGGRTEQVIADAGLGAGLSASGVKAIAADLGQSINAKGGAAVAANQSDLFLSAFGARNGAPTGLYGGYGGVGGGSLFAEQLGGGKGFAETIAQAAAATNGQALTPNAGGVPGFIQNTLSDFGTGVDVLGKSIDSLVSGTKNPYKVSGIPSLGSHVLSQTVAIDQSANAEQRKQFADALDRGVRYRNQDAGGAHVAALSPDQIAAVQSSDLDQYTKQLAAAGTGFVDAAGKVILSTDTVTKAWNAAAVGIQVPDPETYAKSQAQGLKAQFQANEASRQFGQTVSLGQAGLDLAANPFLPATSGIFPTNGLPTGASKGVNEAVRGQLGGVQAEQDQITKEFDSYVKDLVQTVRVQTPELGDQFETLVGQIKGVGQSIAGQQTIIENAQANASAVSFANNLRLATRALKDAKALAGNQQAASSGGEMGGIQRTEFLLQRAAQAISLQIESRQINFSIAQAGFTAPGMTGEERRGRIDEAKQEAELRKKQLGISYQLYDLGGREFAVSVKRAIQDAKASLGVIQANRDAELEIAAANKQIAVDAKRMSVLQARANGIISTAQGNFSASLSSAAGYVATFGGTIKTATSVIAQATGIKDPYAKPAPRPSNNDRGNNATGAMFSAKTPTSFVAGEAAGEHVVILRNPREGTMPATGGGMGGGVQVMISIGNIGSRDDYPELERRLTRSVKEALGREATLLGLRRAI